MLWNSWLGGLCGPAKHGMQEILPTFSEILGLQNFLKKSGLLKTTFCVEDCDDTLLFCRDLCDPGHFDDHDLGDFARKLKRGSSSVLMSRV